MRDPNRLLIFYGYLIDAHRLHFPDWRFGQLIVNFERWIKAAKGYDDIFYIEDGKMLEYIKEFTEGNSLKK